MARTPHRPAGLVDQLQRSHRFTVSVLVSVLVLSLATSGYLILVSQPRLASYVQLAKEARDIHEGMLDQETGLRGWLATGRPAAAAPAPSVAASGSAVPNTVATAVADALAQVKPGTRKARA